MRLAPCSGVNELVLTTEMVQSLDFGNWFELFIRGSLPRNAIQQRTMAVEDPRGVLGVLNHELKTKEMLAKG